jgi:hypothetical protein
MAAADYLSYNLTLVYSQDDIPEYHFKVAYAFQKERFLTIYPYFGEIY